MNNSITKTIMRMALLLLSPGMLPAQEIADTTVEGYRIGYQIGSWLPFVVLAVLFVILLRAVLSKQNDSPKM